ncbi:MAG TPA: transcriptional regulator MntR [Verrucomicrobiota bacterium]|nr:transcriptional regulator MntR [Verrucomicrobiota bacterium]
MAGQPTQSEEDYLERIHELAAGRGFARVSEVAESLRVKQASVTNMVQRLGEQGYLDYEKYRGLVLTEKGRTVACRIQQRHLTLSRFFSALGIGPEAQQRDIEGIEHHLSAETLAALADVARYFEQHPDALAAFRASRATAD